MRTFDEVNEIISALNDADYRATQIAANNFYQTGDKTLLIAISEKVGLTPQEILEMW